MNRTIQINEIFTTYIHNVGVGVCVKTFSNLSLAEDKKKQVYFKR